MGNPMNQGLKAVQESFFLFPVPVKRMTVLNKISFVIVLALGHLRNLL